MLTFNAMNGLNPCSSRVPAAGDELSSDSTHSMTTTEASSEDVFMASNQVQVASIVRGQGLDWG